MKTCNVSGDQAIGASENPRQGIVFLNGNGIERMIMATDAAHGHAQEGPTDGADLLIHDFHAQESLVL